MHFSASSSLLAALLCAPLAAQCPPYLAETLVAFDSGVDCGPDAGRDRDPDDRA